MTKDYLVVVDTTGEKIVAGVESYYRHNQPPERWPRAIELYPWYREGYSIPFGNGKTYPFIKDLPIFQLEGDWEFFYNKISGLVGRSGPFIFSRQSVKKVVEEFVAPRNDAGGRASEVRLEGDTILHINQPGYGSLLEGIVSLQSEELYRLFCHSQAAQA